MLLQREAERDAFLHSRFNGEDTSLNAMIEQQTRELVTLRAKLDEYDRRESYCDRKWTSLIKENSMVTEQVTALKIQEQNQRETYAKILSKTEQRVI